MCRKKIAIAVTASFLLVAGVWLGAQPRAVSGRWTPDWEALDRHETPAWLLDAKIGMQYVGPPPGSR